VVVVSPAASSPPIRDLVDDGLIWRTCGSDTLQAEVLSTLVPAADSLDIVWVTMDPYADNLEKAFVAASGRNDALGIQFDSGDVAGAVGQMNDPEYALLIVDFDAPALVAALATAGQATTQYLMTDSALTPTLWGAGPYDFTFLSRIRGTAPALPAFADPSGPVFAAFEVSYQAAFNQESPADTAFVANAYDAAYAIAIGAAAAGASPTGHAIASNLGRMSDPAGMTVNIGPGDYQAGVNTLVGGGTINLVGTSGPIDWDGQGDVLTAPTEVWQVADDGTGMPTFKVVSTVTP
jgi:ABC-type branched-subunit amino acid transport system substrate-binding protein